MTSKGIFLGKAILLINSGKQFAEIIDNIEINGDKDKFDFYPKRLSAKTS